MEGSKRVVQSLVSVQYCMQISKLLPYALLYAVVCKFFPMSKFQIDIIFEVTDLLCISV